MNMKEIDDVHPVTIIDDRYSGCYSKGVFLAFNLEPWDVPKAVYGGDIDYLDFWGEESEKYIIGNGNTPEEAYQDLVEKVQNAEKNPSKEKPAVNLQLDPKKTFENFIEGDSNKLARKVGLSIAEHPDEIAYNPFYIYGPSGCGKTHLINAIGMRYKEMFPENHLLYVSAREFQMQFTDSVRQNTIKEFINSYQSADMLIVDDIQEWMNAPKTLDTFFHIFNHLVSCGRQIILACDCPPVNLHGMNERVLARFGCGLVAELEKPDMQLCIDILKAKCQHDGLDISDEIIEFIAKSANGNVYVLEGVLNSLKAYSIVCDSNIDMNLVERLIKNIVV